MGATANPGATAILECQRERAIRICGEAVYRSQRPESRYSKEHGGGECMSLTNKKIAH
jgi:hypothetical protein